MECSVQGFPPNVANVLLSVAVRWCDFSRAHQHVWFHSFLVFCFDVHTLCHNYMGRNHHTGHTNSLQWELMCQYDYVNRWLIAYAVLFQVCAVCVCVIWSEVCVVSSVCTPSAPQCLLLLLLNSLPYHWVPILFSCHGNLWLRKRLVESWLITLSVIIGSTTDTAPSLCTYNQTGMACANCQKYAISTEG